MENTTRQGSSVLCVRAVKHCFVVAVLCVVSLPCVWVARETTTMALVSLGFYRCHGDGGLSTEAGRAWGTVAEQVNHVYTARQRRGEGWEARVDRQRE